MSRTPLNEASQRRASAAIENDLAPAPARQRPNGRKPFGTREQKLAYPNREGYHRHWFNDEPGRILRATEAGYTQVIGEDGKPVSTPVGVSRMGGGVLTGYLMEIPIEWYREDMAAQEAEQRIMMDQIKNGQVPGAQTEGQYVPKDRGISIRQDRR